MHVFSVFFQNPQNMTFYVFLSCGTRFLEHWPPEMPPKETAPPPGNSSPHLKHGCCSALPSVFWRCWLDGRKGIRPVKTERWGAGMVICLKGGADLHMAQLMPLPNGQTAVCVCVLYIQTHRQTALLVDKRSGKYLAKLQART